MRQAGDGRRRYWYRGFSEAVSALAGTGWYVAADFWPVSPVAELENLVVADEDAARLRPAALGQQRIRDPAYRNDHIRWLDPQLVAEHDYLLAMQLYRTLLNRRLFLGLRNYECHYASYAPGSCYQRHLDGFHNDRNRLVTTVSFLNRDWRDGDGGELVIYDPDDEQRELIRVLPRAGTFVTFLSEVFPHEVLPAQRQRRSLTGWFRLRE